VPRRTAARLAILSHNPLDLGDRKPFDKDRRGHRVSAGVADAVCEKERIRYVDEEDLLAR
jgi:hypothetical protein